MDITVKCLAVRFPSKRAAAFFEQPRLANLYGLLVKPTNIARPGDPESRKMPFIECLWMPAYAVLLRTTVRGQEKMMWTSVDAWAGDVTLFDAVVELEPCEKTDAFLPPGLDETQAAQAARSGLQKYILRRRGQMNKPVIEAVEQIELFYFPLWIYYFARRGKHIDIKLLDAVTGKSAGPKTRLGVLNALVADRRGAACDINP